MNVILGQLFIFSDREFLNQMSKVKAFLMSTFYKSDSFDGLMIIFGATETPFLARVATRVGPNYEKLSDQAL